MLHKHSVIGGPNKPNDPKNITCDAFDNKNKAKKRVSFAEPLEVEGDGSVHYMHSLQDRKKILIMQ